MNEFTKLFKTFSGVNITKIKAANGGKAFIMFLDDYKAGPVNTADVSSVQIIDTDDRPTVEQEKQALRTISKILDELGPESHLAATFDGCVNIGWRNLELDSYDSYKYFLHLESKRLFEMTKHYKDLENRFNRLQEKLAFLEKW